MEIKHPYPGAFSEAFLVGAMALNKFSDPNLGLRQARYLIVTTLECCFDISEPSVVSNFCLELTKISGSSA